jgi:hypothetical protein
MHISINILFLCSCLTLVLFRFLEYISYIHSFLYSYYYTTQKDANRNIDIFFRACKPAYPVPHMRSALVSTLPKYGPSQEIL